MSELTILQIFVSPLTPANPVVPSNQLTPTILSTFGNSPLPASVKLDQPEPVSSTAEVSSLLPTDSFVPMNPVSPVNPFVVYGDSGDKRNTVKFPPKILAKLKNNCHNGDPVC